MKLRTMNIIIIVASVVLCSAVIASMLLISHRKVLIDGYATNIADSLSAADETLSAYIQSAIFSHETYLNSDMEFSSILNRQGSYDAENEILISTYLLSTYLKQKAPYYSFNDNLSLLIDENGTIFNIRTPMIYSGEDLEDFSQMVDELSGESLSYSGWVILNNDIFDESNKTGLIFCHIRNLYNSSFHYSGKAIFTLSEEFIMSLINNNSLISNGTLKFSKGTPGYSINNGTGTITVTIESSQLPLNWQATISLDSMNEQTVIDFILYSLIICLVSAIAAISAILVSRKATKPLYELMAQMRIASQTQSFKLLPLTEKACSDIRQLFLDYDSLILTINDLIYNKFDLEKKKKQAELDALVAQINPHFLYNTLESIIWKAKAAGDDDIAEMAHLLGSLFRTAVNKGLTMLPLREELENAEAYIKLQNRRYNNRLITHISVDDDKILDAQVLKLILQPVLENSILHALPSTLETMDIYIHAEQTNGIIYIYIEDTGTGIDDDTLKSLQERLTAPFITYSHSDAQKGLRKETGGVGLVNVHQRIQLYYGIKYGLTIESKINAGTTVTIMLPLTNYEKLPQSSQQNQGSFP